ncbi:2-polyprenyl-3-methyl-5-hydroxy-6-metoxy-1,4-benzoquinol methylase [Microterricola gilva]|uniref:2-polyprenyl-3-methyl-5-hydroxy-6-metoxy-1, 4-benzoquinol methylase n=1 Tax=Microterricola gilva TaxID=393267 RepID=A0A4V2GAX5_9MICO|nr:methyltransferase domain-containing protein [Microterricola gilva]RZU65986.1 2-polyprenyl-3-methyl-5-hydroxy-6-metoxy-1,4-benzoquinol methylase [Microterricola gilva]
MASAPETARRPGRFLHARATDTAELMDGPGADPATLQRTYEQFGLVNSAVSGWRANYRRYIRPQLSTTRSTTLLDIGSGGGDLPLALAAWAASDGLRLQITAIDPDARAHDFASARRPVRGVTFRRAFSAELVGEGASFDIVMSNHMLHHLSAAELGGLLWDSERLVRGPGPDEADEARGWSRGGSRPKIPRVLHGDITRGRLAYAGFALGTLPFARSLLKGSYIRKDGLTSIRRSFRPVELEGALPAGWAVWPQSAFRYLLVYPGGAIDG